MGHFQVLSSEFEHLSYLNNDIEEGLHFENDRIETSIEGGVYTLDLDVIKDIHGQHLNVREGHYIMFENHVGTKILTTIMDVEEHRGYKKVHCEDTALILINKIVLPLDEEDRRERTLKEYATAVLQGTGWEIGQNESSERKALNLNTAETIIQRLRKIAQGFGMEFYFEPFIDPPHRPSFKVNFVERRQEGEGHIFRYSSDDLVDSMSRRINIDKLITKLHIYGKEKEGETPPVSDTTGGTVTEQRTQPVATQYDSTKRSQATSPISTVGWDYSYVNNMRVDAADPPYVNGAYIDSFLRRGYSDSPLIGHGDTIKALSDYYGISVGAFLAVASKETVFGRSSSGGRYNFTGITNPVGSFFDGKVPRVWAVDRYWINPSSIKSGVACFFQLARHYVNTNRGDFRAFINSWAPSFENDHSQLYNLYWGVLKAFGYSTSDTQRKKNYSSSSDNPETVNPSLGSKTGGSNQSIAQKTEHDVMIDKMIEWFQTRKGRVTYSMTYRNGPNSYDCSSAVYSALRYAGFKTAVNYLGNTSTLWYDVGQNKLMTQIPMSQARRGDIFLSGAKYEAGLGAAAHTGVFTSNNRIIHCTLSSCGNGIVETGLNCGGTPQYAFRLNVQRNGTLGAPSVGVSGKYEQAVQLALNGIGRPYVWGGATPSGWDCSGFVYYCFKNAGFNLPYRPSVATISSQNYPYKRISAQEARRGDLAVTMGGGHVEILLQPPAQGISVVHAASESLGTIRQNSHSGQLVGYYRVME